MIKHPGTRRHRPSRTVLQVFEQMMQTASERMPAPPPPPPPGTPARRLSSCVVARDGGAEFFAQSPAPGRPASFFRCVFFLGGDGGGLSIDWTFVGLLLLIYVLVVLVETRAIDMWTCRPVGLCLAWL